MHVRPLLADVQYTVSVQMSLRNVALVFGPTLVRNPMRSADLLVSAINAGYTVIEVLCRHVSYVRVFSAKCSKSAQDSDRI